MKKTGVCPKCGNNQLLHSTRVPDDSGSKLGSAYFGLQRVKSTIELVARKIGLKRGASFVAVGQIEAFACRKCGYTEYYLKRPDSIEADGTHVKKIIGPFGDSYR